MTAASLPAVDLSGLDNLDTDWGVWEEELAAVSYARIPTIMRRWLWPGVLPIGNPALFAGKGSVGKGVLFALVAAHIVLGLPFPGTPEYAALERWREADPATRGPRPELGPAGRVIWIAGMEDDQFEDLAPRLRSAICYLVALYGLAPELAHDTTGAIRFVHDLSEWPDGSAFALPVDCDRLAATVKALDTQLAGDNRRRDPEDEHAAPAGPPVRLVVLDPLSDLISDEPAPGVNGARQRYTIDSRQGARRTLRPVKALARKLNISVVIIHHLTQDGKVAGSPAVLDCLRLAFVISARKDDPSVRVITQHKSNISDTPPQQYSTVCGYPDTHAVWIAAADERAERVKTAAAVPEDAGALRARMRTAAREAATGPAPAGYRVLRLRCAPDGSTGAPERVGGASYTSRELARDAAEADALAALAWREVPGSPDREVASLADRYGPGLHVSYVVMPGT